MLLNWLVNKLVFKVTIKEVKGKELPELDDDFAKEVDAEVEGIDAFTYETKRRNC